MAKKVIIGKGKQKSNAVIYGEGIDLQIGKHHLKQKGFKTSEEADKFLEQLGSNDEIRIEINDVRVSPDYIKNQLRHKRIETTLNRFSHNS